MIRSFFILCLIFTACNRETGTAGNESQNHPVEIATNENRQEPVQDSSITFKIIPGENGAVGFGYDIFVDGKLYVHQPTIPAVPGNRAFSTEQKAAQAAQLVVFKIQNQILPPTVEVRELDSLHLLD
jgi:Domain of unknown function (DUF4907)